MQYEAIQYEDYKFNAIISWVLWLIYNKFPYIIPYGKICCWEEEYPTWEMNSLWMIKTLYYVGYKGRAYIYRNNTIPPFIFFNIRNLMMGQVDWDWRPMTLCVPVYILLTVYRKNKRGTDKNVCTCCSIHPSFQPGSL